MMLATSGLLIAAIAIKQRRDQKMVDPEEISDSISLSDLKEAAFTSFHSVRQRVNMLGRRSQRKVEMTEGRWRVGLIGEWAG